jgi:hypothetical protein
MSFVSRVRWAICVTMLGCPLSCGGAVGMMLSEGPQPNGGFGHAPWQMPAGMFFSTAAFMAVWLWIGLCRALVRPFPTAVLFVRTAGLYPLGAGLAMLVAGGLRIREGNPEGFAASIIAILFLVLGWVLVTTARPSDQPGDSEQNGSLGK